MHLIYVHLITAIAEQTALACAGRVIVFEH